MEEFHSGIHPVTSLLRDTSETFDNWTSSFVFFSYLLELDFRGLCSRRFICNCQVRKKPIFYQCFPVLDFFPNLKSQDHSPRRFSGIWLSVKVFFSHINPNNWITELLVSFFFANTFNVDICFKESGCHWREQHFQYFCQRFLGYSHEQRSFSQILSADHDPCVPVRNHHQHR